jgi:hypothetical protein
MSLSAVPSLKGRREWRLKCDLCGRTAPVSCVGTMFIAPVPVRAIRLEDAPNPDTLTQHKCVQGRGCQKDKK